MHVLVASVVVMDTARDFLLGGLVDYFDLPGISAGSAVVPFLVACVDDEDGVLARVLEFLDAWPLCTTLFAQRIYEETELGLGHGD